MKIKFLNFAFTVIVVFFLIGCDKKSDENQTSKLEIYGIVTDKDTGEPVQGVIITLFIDEINLQHSQTTGMDGRYSMTIDRPKYAGYFKIMAYGYETIDYLPFNNSGSDQMQVNFQILPLLLEFPFSGEFGDTYFDVTNTTSRTFHDVYISEYDFPIVIGAYGTHRVNNITNWSPGTTITVSYQGMSNTWEY